MKYLKPAIVIMDYLEPATYIALGAVIVAVIGATYGHI